MALFSPQLQESAGFCRVISKQIRGSYAACPPYVGRHPAQTVGTITFEVMF